MNETINNVTTEVSDELFHIWGEKIDRVILYGSYARGDFTFESDVDIMVLLNCTKEEIKEKRREISRVASRVGLRNDIMVSLLVRDKMEYENEMPYQPFYQNIEKEGVTVYGKK